MTTQPDSDDTADPEARYRRVLSAIHHQTSPVQRPGVTFRTVKTCLCAHADLSPKRVKSTIQAAIDNDDLVAFLDEDSQLRFCLTSAAALDRLVDAYPEVADQINRHQSGAES